MTKRSPLKYFKSSPEIIRLAVMLYGRFPLSLRNVEDLLHEREIDVSHEAVRFWWHRFGPMFASEIRRRRVQQLRAFSRWQWHVVEVFVKIGGDHLYLWRAVDHEGEVLESVVPKRRNKRAALKMLRKLMRRYRRPEVRVTDRFPSYKAALREIGGDDLQLCGRS
jgi:putative transposase